MPTVDPGAGFRVLFERRGLNGPGVGVRRHPPCRRPRGGGRGPPPLGGLYVRTGTLAVTPVVALRRFDAMVPWEVLALATLPALWRTAYLTDVAGALSKRLGRADA